jgi:hypothetical protein
MFVTSILFRVTFCHGADVGLKHSKDQVVPDLATAPTGCALIPEPLLHWARPQMRSKSRHRGPELPKRLFPTEILQC